MLSPNLRNFAHCATNRYGKPFIFENLNVPATALDIEPIAEFQK
ncbi:MAG: hypothetical protein AAGK47_10130 [Bacteroidota bacterium]